VSITASTDNKIVEPQIDGPIARRGGDSAAVPVSAGEPAKERKLGKREVLTIISGLALAMFLSALNQTIVATIV